MTWRLVSKSELSNSVFVHVTGQLIKAQVNQFLFRTFVVYVNGGLLFLLLERHLTSDSAEGFFLRKAISLHQPLQLRIFAAPNHDYGVTEVNQKL